MSKKGSKKKAGEKNKKSKEFDKYYYYKASVQSPENDVEFLRDCYKELRGKSPRTLREDFCGTFAISCEWVKLNSKNYAYGIDLDKEPIKYGKANYLTQLSKEQQERVEIQNKNVLDKKLPSTDVIAAMNFSYFIFKTREQLKAYFKNCLKTLDKNGVLICDCFGGPHCMEPNEEETVHKNFSYYWDQDYYDPVTNHALFYIHFQRKGEKKREKCFTYDWRMWSIPEIRDIMEEVGFNKVHTYWEGTDEDGDGDGDFKRVKEGEDCEAWVAYIVGEK